MKRLLIVVPSLGIGGVETIVRNLLRNIDKEFFYIELLTFKDEIEDRKSFGDIKINILPIVSFKDIVRVLPKILKISYGFDIVHAHTFYSIVFLRLIKIFNPKVRLICSEHCTITYPVMKYKYIYIVTNFLSNLNTNVSLASAKSFIDYNYVKEMKVVYNGISPLAQSDKEFRYDFLFKRFDKVFLSVGRLSKEKDYNNLLQAFYLTLQETKKNIALFIVGDGPLRKDLDNIIRDLGMQENIYLLGAHMDIYNFYRRSNFFVLSSSTEALPTVLIEAMFCNNIIISTDCGGVKEILGSGYPFLVPTHSSILLSKALTDALKMENINFNINNYYKKRVNVFSMNSFIAKWERIYKDVL